MALEKSVIADHKKAGEILVQALEYGKCLIAVDVNTLEVCQKIEKKILSLGGTPAFPAQPSINEVAAHWCPNPSETRVFKAGDLVKLDCGVHINGHIADAAISIDLSDDKRWKDLIKAAEDARDAAMKLMTPGRQLGEIGATIQQTITEAGFSPIKNLSGHGLEPYEVHTWPSIPNIDTGDQTELEEDMVLAVEPFATTGQGEVYEQDVGNIYEMQQPRPVRSQYARKAMKLIEKYNGVPFSLHQLAAQMGEGAAKFAMRELERQEIVHTYPPLVEVTGKTVSQAEHSVIVADKPIVFTRL